MIILAVDPGYDRLGIAILEKNKKEKLIFSECFETNKDENINIRMMRIGQRIREIIHLYEPEVLVIEGLFFSKNTKTALKVSESRGVILFQASDLGLDIYEYTPNQIKVAVTGYGRSTKSEVHTMVSRLIDIGDEKKIDDEIDAIAIGLTFFASHRFQQKIEQ
ncbi:MAG: crossover junction endodeoxyribonuclease RuvC [Crocinitomicaceae bacterium]|jgi:crossover junction endodeoxyribonuclease RuvC